MKKICSLILIFLLMFSIGCSNKPTDKIASISFSDEFKESTIYVGDTIDPSQTYVVVTYKSEETENIALSLLGITKIDTEKSGIHTMQIIYKDKSATLEYYVNEPVVIDAQFSETLEFYVGEDVNFANYSMVVLYNNGKTEIVSFNNCNIAQIDYSVTGQVKQLSVEYKGYAKTISYYVTYREIVENTEYLLVDRTELLNGEFLAVVNNKKLTVYAQSDEENVYTTKTLEEGAYNTYTLKWIKSGIFVDVVLSLQDGCLVLEYASAE